MARVLLVRHGISEYNSARRFAGSSDVDLTADGYQQIERLRDRLAGEKIDVAYCSNLRRALKTAEAICEKHCVEITQCPELQEIHYGDVEGLKFDEIKDRFPGLAKQITDFESRIDFPGGETFEGFARRISLFLDRLEKHGNGQTVLVVAHGGPIQTLVCHLLGIDVKHWRQIRVDNASLTIMHTSPRGAVISLLNDTSHLKVNS